MKAQNKVFVVTGSGGGVGRELAIQLVNRGARVALVDINEKGLLETVRIAGEPYVSYFLTDIRDREDVNRLPELVIEQLGAVDGLINNAGIIQPFLGIQDLDDETIERVFNVNFYGTLNMTRAFLPHLLKRPEAHIANISSMGGFIPFPGQSVYSASKAAVKLFTEGLYSELVDSNVGVTIIHPGAVNTNIKSNSGLASSEAEDRSDEKTAGKILQADKAAGQIIEAIEKNKFRAMIGKDAKLLDRLYRISPEKSVNLVQRKMKSNNAA